MSQDLIRWATGILSKPAVSKYAYSEMIISRGEDPKWQVPCLSSPTHNLRSDALPMKVDFGADSIEASAKTHLKHSTGMRLLRLAWHTAGGRFEVSVRGVAALFHNNYRFRHWLLSDMFSIRLNWAGINPSNESEGDKNYMKQHRIFWHLQFYRHALSLSHRPLDIIWGLRAYT